jgi:hypothetical protein
VYVDPGDACTNCRKRDVSCGEKAFAKISGGTRNEQNRESHVHQGDILRNGDYVLRQIFRNERMRNVEEIHEMFSKAKPQNSKDFSC